MLFCLLQSGEHNCLFSYSRNLVTIQGWAKRRSPDLVNFSIAVAHHFCLALSAAFMQPGAHLLAEHCTSTDCCKRFKAANCRARFNCSSHVARIMAELISNSRYKPAKRGEREISPSSVTSGIFNQVIHSSCIPLSDMMSQKKPVMTVAPSGGMLTPNNHQESKDGWMMDLTSLMKSTLILKSPVVSRKLRY